MIKLTIQHESWPIQGSFTISRGSKTSADVVTVTLQDGEYTGRGECVPYARYGETIEGVRAAIEDLRGDIENGLDRHALQQAMPSGAARNAIDCALWDLEAKRSGIPVWRSAGLQTAPQPVTTAYTLSLDTAEAMHQAATHHAHRPLLKLKLGGDGDAERVRAVREGAPHATLILDANEGWDAAMYEQIIPIFQDLNVAMIEQPFPVGKDDILEDVPRPITLCADESCHDTQGFADLVEKYDMINIKLDKTGGLTEALKLKACAEDAGMQIMVGCMLATSLAMAPALLVGQNVDIVDLDGPLLLAIDRADGLTFQGSTILPPHPELWG